MESKYILVVRLLIVLLIGLTFYNGILSNLNFQIDIGNATVLKFSISNSNLGPSNVVKVDRKVSKVEPFIPKRILIPDIQVDSQVVPVKTEDGQINAPLDFTQVGWSEKSAKVGSLGTVLLDGHYDSKSGPAVFYKLKALKLDQLITVYSDIGESFVYRVVCMEDYETANAPLEKIYKNDNRSRLNLITCSGTFNRDLGHYNRRLVVYCLIYK